MELLLTTPLDTRQIVQGQQSGLRHLFRLALPWILLMDFILVSSAFTASDSSNQFLGRSRALRLALALERYRREHGGARPADPAALAPAYLEQVPRHPQNARPLIYEWQGNGYKISFVISGSNLGEKTFSLQVNR